MLLNLQKIFLESDPSGERFDLKVTVFPDDICRGPTKNTGVSDRQDRDRCRSELIRVKSTGEVDDRQIRLFSGIPVSGVVFRKGWS